MKLASIIYEEGALGFKTTQTGVDPETGQVTWDVEYTPLIKIDSNLEELSNEFELAIEKHPEDEKLKQYNDILKNFKKSFRNHVTRKYK